MMHIPLIAGAALAAVCIAVTACTQIPGRGAGQTVILKAAAPVDAAAYTIAFNQSRLQYAIWFWQNGYDDSKFASSLTGGDAVVIPPSGYTRRDVTAVIRRKSDDRPTNLPVVYSVVDENGGPPDIAGLTFNDLRRDGEEGMLYIHSAVSFAGDTRRIYIKAEAKHPAKGAAPISTTLAVDLRKTSPLTGAPPRDGPRTAIAPGGADGKAEITGGGPLGTWKLFYHDEFDKDLGGGMGQGAGWSPYYLRSWNSDERSKRSAVSFVGDGLFFITSNRGMDIVNAHDGSQRISGVQTYEAPYLHRWGGVPVKSRELPRYDGFSAKYGYYETRMKLPNTRDGNHFAWWMVGVQTDEHPSVRNAGGDYLFDTAGKAGWGWTNHGAEYDVMEQHLDPVYHADFYLGWNTSVHHPNGSNELTGALGWVENRFPYAAQNPPVDPFNEFHTYGLDWREDGCDYYFDGRKAFSAPAAASANYKMLHIFSLYMGKTKYWSGEGGMGPDRGIYPKEALIDYFRVWKKDEPPSPHSIQIYDAPYYFKKPASGSAVYRMRCRLLDQFDVEIAPTGNGVKWGFSENISGSADSRAEHYGKNTIVTAKGNVTIDETSGMVTIPSTAGNVDLYVIAYLDDSDIPWARGVREVRHIKIADGAGKPRLVQFTNPAWKNENRGVVRRGTTVDVSAAVYDQYFAEYGGAAIKYSIVTDVMADRPANIPGVSLNGNRLTIGSAVPVGTAIIVNARTRRKVPFEGYGAVRGSSPVEQGLGPRRPDGGYDEGPAGHVDYVMQNLVLRVAE
jgi:hypothetical protein